MVRELKRMQGEAMTRTAMIPLRQAADRLGVHENTIRNWIDRGVVHGIKLPTGTRRLPAAELERLEREMFAMPSSVPPEAVVPAPKPVFAHDVTPPAYPDV